MMGPAEGPGCRYGDDYLRYSPLLAPPPAQSKFQSVRTTRSNHTKPAVTKMEVNLTRGRQAQSETFCQDPGSRTACRKGAYAPPHLEGRYYGDQSANDELLSEFDRLRTFYLCRNRA